MTNRTRLTDDEIAARLPALGEWKLADGRLHRELRFGDFSAAFAFMTRVALEAEKLDHHPDWSNAYSRVVIDLFTHDAGGVTERDFELARRIEALLGSGR